MNPANMILTNYVFIAIFCGAGYIICCFLLFICDIISQQKEYYYIIFYRFNLTITDYDAAATNSEIRPGLGRIQITEAKPIDSINRVRDIERFLDDRAPHRAMHVLTNYILLKKAKK